MNDTKLVELVLESPIEDLTLEQIQELRARLSESPEIRAALIDRLRMDQHLVDIFGASGDTPDQFIAKVLRRKEKQSSGSRVALGLVIGLLIFGAAGALAVYQMDMLPKRPLAASTDIDEPSPNPVSERDHSQKEQAPESPDKNIDSDAADKPEGEAAAAEKQTPDPTGDAPDTAEPMPQERNVADVPPEPIKVDPVLTVKDIEPITFAHLTSLPDGQRHESLTKAQVEAWMSKASDALPAAIEEFRERDHPQARIKGWFRLNGRLPSGAAMRVHFSNLDHVRFHFYHGDQGVTVIRHRHDYDPWYAYAMTRGEHGVRPKDLRLQANDHYRDHRSEARDYNPIVFYFDEGTQEIVFYRGDAEVIRAVMPGPPEDIYIEGESVVRQMELLPISEFPRRTEDYPVQLGYDRPADLPWQQKLAEGVSFKTREDGSVSLQANSAKDNAWICTSVPGYGLRMVELEIEGFDKAHSLFLAKPKPAPEEGKEPEIPSPQDGIVFSKNRKTGNFYARFSNCFDTSHEVDRDPLDSPSVEVRDQAWIRLLAGGGQIRGWVSLDGKNWAVLPSEDRNGAEHNHYVGISTAKLDGDYELTIKRIKVRELPALTGLFPQEHWEAVAQIPWSQLEKSLRPDEAYTIDDDRQIKPDLATQLLRLRGDGGSFDELVALAEACLEKAKSADEQKQMLQELLALMRTWPLGNSEKQFLTWCKQELGEIFLRQLSTPQRQSYASFRRDLFNLPTMNRDKTDHLSRDRFNAEILAAIEQERWTDILDSCETLQRYYSEDPRRMRRDFPIVNWAGGVAVRHVGRPGVSQDYLAEGRSSSMLVEDLSKEAYNISAELNAALDGGAIADACRLITQIPESAAEGLAPSGSDPDHMFSVPAAIQMAVQNHDQLKQQMREKYSDLAQLRVNSAIQRGDRRVVELVTLQYFDTQAAAQAHLWLGDQATAAGDFATSLQHYLKAARSAEPPLKDEVDARLLMMGHWNSGPPQDALSQSVSVGGSSLSTNSLVDETRVIRGSVQPHDQEHGAAPPPALEKVWPESAELKQTDLEIEWLWGNEKDRVPGAIRDSQSDWRSNYLSTTVQGDEAYICNRFELARINLKDSKLVWKEKQRDKDRGKAHRYPLSRCVPLVLEDQVVVRLLHEKGFALYSFDRKTGKVNWDANLDGKLVLATDPVSVQGRVLIVTLREVSQSTYAVRLSRIDLATGEIMESHPLFRIRDTWFDRGIGNLVPHREQLLIDLGCVLASCDISGHLQWVRKQLTFPQDIDERWGSQELSNLVVVGDRAVAYHAGTLRLECFDIATGKLFWTSDAGDVQSISSLDGDSILVERPQSWVRKDIGTGNDLGRVDKPESLIHWQTGGNSVVAIVKQQQDKEQEGDASKPSLQALRIDLRDGSRDSLQSFATPLDKEPAFGAPFFAGEKWYFWFAEEGKSDKRRLVRLQ